MLPESELTEIRARAEAVPLEPPFSHGAFAIADRRKLLAHITELQRQLHCAMTGLAAIREQERSSAGASDNCTCVGFGLTRVHDDHCPVRRAPEPSEEPIDAAAVERLAKYFDTNAKVADKNDGTFPMSGMQCAYTSSMLRKLLVAASSGEPGAIQGWQGIETAPKDGTMIFIHAPGWDSAPLAKWGDYPGNPVMADDSQEVDMEGWLIEDESFCAGHEDGFLGWQDDPMPIRWMPMYTCSFPTKEGEL